MLLESAFPKLFCVIFSQKLVTFFRVIQENKSGFFLKTVYIVYWRMVIMECRKNVLHHTKKDGKLSSREQFKQYMPRGKCPGSHLIQS